MFHKVPGSKSCLTERQWEAACFSRPYELDFPKEESCYFSIHQSRFCWKLRKTIVYRISSCPKSSLNWEDLPWSPPALSHPLVTLCPYSSLVMLAFLLLKLAAEHQALPLGLWGMLDGPSTAKVSPRPHPWCLKGHPIQNRSCLWQLCWIFPFLHLLHYALLFYI